MRIGIHLASIGLIVIGTGNAATGASASPAAPAPDAVRTLVSRLDLERYKATIKGLTQFGDRRQGTERNRKAVDWIEAQLKSYGCATERIKYTYEPPPPAPATAQTGDAAGAESQRPGGGRRTAARHPHAHRRQHRPDAAARREAARAEQRALHARPARGGLLHQGRHARGPTRCTSSARTWTATAGARPPTTTARARRW